LKSNENLYELENLDDEEVQLGSDSSGSNYGNYRHGIIGVGSERSENIRITAGVGDINVPEGKLVI
jgi:hypothetical protein